MSAHQALVDAILEVSSYLERSICDITPDSSTIAENDFGDVNDRYRGGDRGVDGLQQDAKP